MVKACKTAYDSRTRILNWRPKSEGNYRPVSCARVRVRVRVRVPKSMSMSVSACEYVAVCTSMRPIRER